MKTKIVKVIDTGRISLPSIIRECTRIKKGKIILLDKIKKRDFRYLLKHSEKVAEKLWSNKEDDFWDNI